MRIVIATTDFISAMIGKQHRMKLMSVLECNDIEIFADNNLLTELTEVAFRNKFRKYVLPHEVTFFLDVVKTSLTIITTSTIVTDSPDPDDNNLLALVIDAQAEYLITGNKVDLLALSPYRGIQIIRLQTFLEVISAS